MLSIGYVSAFFSFCAHSCSMFLRLHLPLPQNQQLPSPPQPSPKPSHAVCPLHACLSPGVVLRHPEFPHPVVLCPVTPAAHHSYIDSCFNSCHSDMSTHMYTDLHTDIYPECTSIMIPLSPHQGRPARSHSSASSVSSEGAASTSSSEPEVTDLSAGDQAPPPFPVTHSLTLLFYYIHHWVHLF